MEGAKRKIAAENADLLRQLQEMENSANMLSKLKLTLADQLDEARAVADHEAKQWGKIWRVEDEVAQNIPRPWLEIDACSEEPPRASFEQ